MSAEGTKSETPGHGPAPSQDHHDFVGVLRQTQANAEFLFRFAPVHEHDPSRGIPSESLRQAGLRLQESMMWTTCATPTARPSTLQGRPSLPRRPPARGDFKPRTPPTAQGLIPPNTPLIPSPVFRGVFLPRFKSHRRRPSLNAAAGQTQPKPPPTRLSPPLSAASGETPPECSEKQHRTPDSPCFRRRALKISPRHTARPGRSRSK